MAKLPYLNLKIGGNKMSENYIIIHGSFGSKDGNWFPWLKKELEQKEKQVVVPHFNISKVVNKHRFINSIKI